MTVTLAAALATLCVLLLLAWRDPARLKAASRKGKTDAAAGAWTGRRRLVLGLVAAAPGLGLAASGAWAEFAMWFGLLPISGWLTARTLSGAR